MKEEFSANAASLFGSGWTWIIVNTDNQKLEIMNTSNQNNPHMDVVDKNGIPLLVIDIWEHAYYLKYQNKRPDYIANFWNIVNWKRMSERYAAAV
jgi:Fe-Mn family superoxide dismutase